MIKNGSVVTGKVTSIQNYGVFVKVDDYVGLIHISELSDRFVRNVRDYLTIGDIIDLKVLDIDQEQRKLKLSYKAIKERRINRRYKIGFTTVEKKMSSWIESKLKEMKKNE
ncbi:S1 RNA-binding domain-containing protein [Mycoplasmatota bacterium zrk1]